MGNYKKKGIFAFEEKLPHRARRLVKGIASGSTSAERALEKILFLCFANSPRKDDREEHLRRHPPPADADWMTPYDLRSRPGRGGLSSRMLTYGIDWSAVPVSTL
ncbi:hypothetical protein EVAR_50072_1 [Eumeta japonica]|uniref:Uncharacterized protein n=1 Tax=Eumeta variegata TaxID=151549 RepID=A0A4C1XGS2_EUMVA|nr:hypothetical protein EVAR_50072_1 [Eumeta japonica]